MIYVVHSSQHVHLRVPYTYVHYTCTLRVPYNTYVHYTCTLRVPYTVCVLRVFIMSIYIYIYMCVLYTIYICVLRVYIYTYTDINFNVHLIRRFRTENIRRFFVSQITPSCCPRGLPLSV